MADTDLVESIDDTDNGDKPDSSALITVRNLCKGFNSSGSRIEILKDLNLDLDTEETVAVVGASGIGKSTLLHILGTLDRPDSGSLRYRGEDVFQYDDIKLAEFRNKTIGFVFQFHHLLPEFSTVENVMMPGLIKGLRRQEALEVAESMLIKVGMQDRLNQRVDKLSGGEQQRVALARALILKPVILLADEPTGNLDKQHSEQIHNLLLELNSELGMTLVVTTHNMELASFMSRCMTIVNRQLKEV